MDNNNDNNNNNSTPNIKQAQIKMPVNRSHLDALADKFADSRDNNDFAEFMHELENSMVCIPAQAPVEGEPPKVCLLAKDDGSKVFPVFTSTQQIPADKRPPAVVTIHFKQVVALVKNNSDELSQVAVNPFTKGFVLNESLIDLVDKRYKAGANNPGQGTSVQVTEQQMHALAHVKMVRGYLAQEFYKDPAKVLSDIKLNKEKYILEAYRHVYPQNIRTPYTLDDFAVMCLQIEEGLIITRIDLPEKYTQEGSPLRIYITEYGDKYGYYLIEKGAKGSPGMITSVDENGEHIKIEEAPDNGAEIESVMSLIRPS